MNKIIFLLLALAFAAYAQQISVAVLPSESMDAALSNSEENALTDKMREAALNVLPASTFTLLNQDAVVKRLGGAESYIKECKESSCIVDLGKKAQVDYVAKAIVRKLGGKLILNAELYRVSTSGLVGVFNGEADNAYGLIGLIGKNVPEVFRKIPGASKASAGTRPTGPSVAGGISGVQSADDDYVPEFEKFHLVNVATEPSGAILSFNGEPVSGCTQSPCKAQLAEGNVRIVAVLDQYEKQDTTVSVRQNNQSVNIKLKSNFGILEVKPAYSDGVGRNEGWSLMINGKASSSYENRLSPGKYNVKLGHKCYEDISFDVGINKGSREVFDMEKHIKLKRGALVLSAEKDGQPASEPVFVDGKRVGETPFSGTVAVCSEIEIGSSREKIAVKLENRQTVRHTHKIAGGGVFTDSRDGKKYKTVKIGSQTWMAENLNYDAHGSKCYDNKPDNCAKYGRLYNWQTARTACPNGWHLPSKAEWEKLTSAVGGEKTEGLKLKAKSGWNSNGNGTDDFGFSALPGGNGDSDGSFSNVGYGYWWSSSEYDSYSAYYRDMYYSYEGASWGNDGKTSLRSVRCLQD